MKEEDEEEEGVETEEEQQEKRNEENEKRGNRKNTFSVGNFKEWKKGIEKFLNHNDKGKK